MISLHLALFVLASPAALRSRADRGLYTSKAESFSSVNFRFERAVCSSQQSFAPVVGYLVSQARSVLLAFQLCNIPLWLPAERVRRRQPVGFDVIVRRPSPGPANCHGLQSIELDRILQSARATGVYRNRIAIIQEGRRLHGQSKPAWSSDHNQRPLLLSLTLTTPCLKPPGTKAKIRSLASLKPFATD